MDAQKIEKYSTSKPQSRGIIHRLQWGDPLGEGAHSEVYRVQVDGRSYALKRYSGLDVDSGLREFRREAALHAGLNHKAIPQIYEVGLFQGLPYLISQLVDGPHLEACLREGPLSEEDALHCVITLADALAQVHTRGLVHRDIKPSNILRDKTGAFHLIDFGLAGHDDAQIGDGAVGTLQYCAPEQLGLLEHPIDGRADLYALGGVFFECLTGRPPFISSDVHTLLHQHAAVVPPRVDDIQPGHCPVLSDIIAKCLNKEPDERYQTANSLLFDLKQLSRLRKRQASGKKLCLGFRSKSAGSRRFFVGRQRELHHLKTSWAQAENGRGCVVFVEGPPGGGKSDLVNQFVQEHLRNSPLFLRAKCSEDDPYPLAPIRGALSLYINEHRGQLEGVGLKHLHEAAGELGEILQQLGPDVASALGETQRELKQEDGKEVFFNAVATFLLNLAETAGEAILWIDDIQWLDDASIEALQLLVSRLSDRPLLLILSGRNDPDSQAGLNLAHTCFGANDANRLVLAPLNEKELELLISKVLGKNIGTDISNTLITRSQGSPLAIWQYIEAMKEEGILTPHWGSWIVDNEKLGAIELPNSLYDLMALRLGHLSPQSLDILKVAAFLGDPINYKILINMRGPNSFKSVQQAITEGLQSQLMEPIVGGNGYRFVHDRIRETLLETLLEDRTAMHRRACAALEAEGIVEPREVYALAQHTYLGYGNEVPFKSYWALMRAASLANQQHAYAKALETITQIESLNILEEMDGEEQLHFHQEASVACFNTDQIQQATIHCEAGLELTEDPITRALLRVNIAKGTVFTFNTTQGAKEIERAFEELGQPLPSSSIKTPQDLMPFLMNLMAESLAVVDSGEGFGVSTGQERLIHEAIVDLCESGFLIGYYARNKLFSLQCGILAVKPAWALGENGISCRGFSTFSFLNGLLGRRDKTESFANRALNMAERLGERQTLAMTQNTAALGLHLGDHADRALKLQRQVYFSYSDWLGPINFQNCCVDLITNNGFRGLADRQLEVALKAIERLKTKEGPFMAGYLCRANAAAMDASATLGKMEEARSHLKEVERLRHVVPPDRAVPWVSVAGFKVNFYVQLGEFGEPFEEAIAEHENWGFPGNQAAHHSKHFYLYQGYGRLTALRQCKSLNHKEFEEKFRVASEALTLASAMSTMRPHAKVLEANVALLDGKRDHGLSLLEEANRLATDVDNPWALFEIAVTRAHLYRKEKRPRAMTLETNRARTLAQSQGWTPRLRLLEQTFALQRNGAPTGENTNSIAASVSARIGGGSTSRLQRQLDALISLSQASALITDPMEQKTVCLDESARLLGAERVYLFLVDNEKDTLRFAKGRTGTGEDLPEPEGYSKTIVERVRRTKEAVILSTSGDAQELRSQSVMVYGLRSVLAAPLLYGDQLFGVIYLDNRLIRGIFDADHISLVMALGQHITTVIRHTRAAKLEQDLRAETERRHLAELLRRINSRLTSTLNLEETLRFLTEALVDELKVTRLVAAVHGEKELQPIVCLGEPENGLSVATENILQGVFLEPPAEPVIQQWLGGAALILPLRSRSVNVGVVVLIRPQEAGFPESEVNLAAALVGQAGIATDNARLFRQVKEYAERDELTGLFNRREFFRRADEFVELAHRHGGPLAALLFDVDHFKRFNDTYGHATGDEVLRIVSKTSSAAIRDVDLLGRYGGEEFAVFLPGATIKVAELVAERLRKAIEDAALDTADHGMLRVAVSIGVTPFVPGDTSESLLGRADQALYGSKDAGRNCVTVLMPQ